MTKEVTVTPKIKSAAIVAIIAVVIVFLLGNCFTVVEAGHTGVVVTLGKVNEGVLQEGLHVKVPFVQQVVKIDNRIVKLEVATEAFSKDLQTVSTTLAIYVHPTLSKKRAKMERLGG